MELALMQTCLLVHGCCRHQLHLPQMVFLILSNSHSRKGLPSSTLYRHLQVWNRQVRKWAVASCKQLITIILFRVLLPISQFQSLKLSNLQRSVGGRWKTFSVICLESRTPGLELSWWRNSPCTSRQLLGRSPCQVYDNLNVDPDMANFNPQCCLLSQSL